MKRAVQDISLPRFVVYCALVAFSVFLFCPALLSTGWHLRHKNRIEWHGNQFLLPMAWAVGSSNLAPQKQIMLVRRSWFVFASTAQNSLFISQIDPKTMPQLLDVKLAMAMTQKPVTYTSETINGHIYECLSQPMPQPRFSLRYLNEIHARCEFKENKLVFEYFGSPKVLGEALDIVVSSRKQ